MRYYVKASAESLCFFEFFCVRFYAFVHFAESSYNMSFVSIIVRNHIVLVCISFSDLL